MKKTVLAGIASLAAVLSCTYDIAVQPERVPPPVYERSQPTLETRLEAPQPTPELLPRPYQATSELYLR